MNTYVFVYSSTSSWANYETEEEMIIVAEGRVQESQQLQKVICDGKQVWPREAPTIPQVCTTKNPCETRAFVQPLEIEISSDKGDSYLWIDNNCRARITYCPFCGTKLEE